MDLIKGNRDIFLYSTAGGSMFPLIRWREYLIVKKSRFQLFLYGKDPFLAVPV